MTTTPPCSLRGGNALDNHEAPPPYDLADDTPTPQYLEANAWGMHHLDPVSWKFYLPIFIAYALSNISNPKAAAIDTFLFSLRPPDRDPPRLGSLSPDERSAVVALLDKLTFDSISVWKEGAITALEEYWAPGALYSGTRET